MLLLGERCQCSGERVDPEMCVKHFGSFHAF